MKTIFLLFLVILRKTLINLNHISHRKRRNWENGIPQSSVHSNGIWLPCNARRGSKEEVEYEEEWVGSWLLGQKCFDPLQLIN